MHSQKKKKTENFYCAKINYLSKRPGVENMKSKQILENVFAK